MSCNAWDNQTDKKTTALQAKNKTNWAKQSFETEKSSNKVQEKKKKKVYQRKNNK